MPHKNIGIWIDHHKAVIVELDELGCANITEVKSDVASKHRSTGGTGSSRPFLHRCVFSGKHQTAHRLNDLQAFYANVSSKVKDASRVWIFGPSLARHELFSYLKEHAENGIQFDESAAFVSRATEAQIVERVRAHFHKSIPRIYPISPGQPQSQSQGFG